jgi:hypothetical protein
MASGLSLLAWIAVTAMDSSILCVDSCHWFQSVARVVLAKTETGACCCLADTEASDLLGQVVPLTALDLLSNLPSMAQDLLVRLQQQGSADLEADQARLMELLEDTLPAQLEQVKQDMAAKLKQVCVGCGSACQWDGSVTLCMELWDIQCTYNVIP